MKSGESISTKYPEGCIYVLPLGEFPKDSSPDFDSLVEYAKVFFCYNVKKLPTAKIDFDGENVYWIQEEQDDHCSTKVNRKEELSSRYALLLLHIYFSDNRGTFGKTFYPREPTVRCFMVGKRNCHAPSVE